MLVILSPAKTLDFQTPSPTTQFSQPQFLEQAEQLVTLCRQLSPAQLASLLKISDKLAALNVARYAQWQRPFTIDNAKQALFTFKGEVYNGLQANTLSQQAITFAQQHL